MWVHVLGASGPSVGQAYDKARKGFLHLGSLLLGKLRILSCGGLSVALIWGAPGSKG